MNRRDAIKTGLAVLSSSRIDGEVATISARNPQALIVNTRSRLTPEQLAAIKREFERAFRGSAFANVPVIVLPNDIQLEVIDRID